MTENRILRQSAGTIATATGGELLNPAVVATSLEAGGFEVFLAYKDYTSGTYTSPIVPVKVFGEISLDYFIVDEEE
jgi:hypothetical protein